MKQIVSALVGLGLFATPALALAQGVKVRVNESIRVTASSTDAKLTVRVSEKVSRAQSRASAEINRRIESLDKLYTRIGGMKLLASSDQTSLQATLAAQIQSLRALEVKINATTSTTTLKTDIDSIKKSYRTYVLTLPRLSIMAAADRALHVADQMNALAAKLETRIASSTAATSTHSTGSGQAASATTTLRATLTHMRAEIASAQAEAKAALALVVDLKPDNGDQAVMEANRQALKDARAKIRAAQQDLRDARKDAREIAKLLRRLAKADKDDN